MDSQPSISVVIPAYGRGERLRMALESAIHQDLPPDRYELLVVDSSPDAGNQRLVESMAREAPCRVRCYRKPAEGPGPSRNLGAQEARGEYIAFLDSDCVATPGWLSAGLARFAPGVGLVQGRTLPDPQVKTGIFTHYVNIERESPLYETANIFYRRTALLETPGFTPDLQPRSQQPMGGEDTRVGWQVKRAGWTSTYAHEALVYHEVRAMPVWKWFLHKRLYVFPPLVREIPELRNHCYLGYFYDRAQAAVVLGLAGTVLAPVSPLALAAWLPYLILRASEPSRSLGGLLRPLRAALYLPRDLACFAVLAFSSLRHRSLLL